MNTIKKLKERKQEIIRAIAITEQRKRLLLSRDLDNTTKEQWSEYYDKYLTYYRKSASMCDKLIRKENKRAGKGITIAIIIILVIIGIILSFLIFNLRTEIGSFFKEGVRTKFTFEEAKIPINLESGEILNELLFQYPAKLGNFVKWKKQFTTTTPSRFSFELPLGSENIKIKRGGQDITPSIKIEEIGILSKKLEIIVEETGTEFEIEYETLAPILEEQETAKGKQVTIISPTGIPYENILSSVEISEKLEKHEKDKIKVIEITQEDGQETRQDIPFTAYDTNENDFIDSVEWIGRTEASYEIIFITKAEHLNSNKEFLSDIYPSVFQLDNNWSEPIYHNEYIRVIFEKPLSKENDITLYVKNQQQLNTIIEVFQDDQKITEFPIITAEGEYKIFLTSLEGSHNTFDLRIKNLNENEQAYLEFDYIVDPPLLLNLYVDGFIPATQEWTELGSSPWLDAQDTNIIEANARALTHGEFTFQNLPPGEITINSVTLFLYIDTGTESIQAEVWDGKRWNPFNFQGTGLQSVSLPTLDTIDKINNARLNLISRQIGRWTGTVQADMAYLYINAAANNPLEITYVEPISDQSPTEAGITTVVFETQVRDLDGVDDINDASVIAEFSFDSLSKQGACLWQNDIDTNTANYSCSIDMQYYDNPGAWNIKINATDTSDTLAENTSTSFNYLPLLAMVISPTLINWPTINTGDTNQIPGVSTIITNTGNYNGTIGIQAIDLYGETYPSQFIPASAFTAGEDPSGNNKQCSAPVSASFLQNGTYTQIINSVINKGPGEQEEIFYCIPQVPAVSTQTYSTESAGSWSITILAAILTIKKRKRKKKKRLSDTNSIKALNFLSIELKQEFSKEKQNIINLLIKQIKKKYRINTKQISELIDIRKDIKIPINIFSGKLEALEAISKYMKENLNLPYNEISSLLHRDERTIWTAYHRAIKKQSKAFKLKKTEPIPINIFKKRLTILESIIVHLKKEMKYSEIARLLSRDQRNIWTIYSRAQKKIKRKV